jgi:hypothetical protein
LKRSWPKLLIILGIVGPVALGCGTLCYRVVESLSRPLPNACDPKTPEITEEMGQFKFPPSVSALKSSCFGMQGWDGYAQFEMSPDDLDYFVSHLQIKSPLANSITPGDDSMATRASPLKSFLYGRYDITYKNNDTFSQSVFIDTSNPAQYFVTINFSGG